MKVGTICKLKVDCLGNKAGTLGVVFFDNDGIMVIFANGHYDGFSTRIQMGGSGRNPMMDSEALAFLEVVGFEESLAGYQFESVIQVSNDFDLGLFNIVWSDKWKKPATECTCDLNTLVSGSGTKEAPMIILYCPLHEAAPDLLVCCKRYIRMQEEVYGEMGKKPSGTMYQMMIEAVTKAKRK